MSEKYCPKCNAPIELKRTGYGTEVSSCKVCGYKEITGQTEFKEKRVNLGKPRDKKNMWGWEPSLTLFTVIIQLVTGSYLTILITKYLFPQSSSLSQTTLTFLWIPAVIGMLISVSHGKNILTVVNMFRTVGSSQLSREVLFLLIFTILLILYPLRGFLIPASTPLVIHDIVSIIIGVVAVASMARIYNLPSRPCWNHVYTPISFTLTLLILGPTAFLMTMSFLSGNILLLQQFLTYSLIFVAILSLIDILAFRGYRLFLKSGGDDLKTCLVELESRKHLLKTKIALRYITILVAVASIFSTYLSTSTIGIMLSICFVVSLSCEIISRALFYSTLGISIGEQRFLKSIRRL